MKKNTIKARILRVKPNCSSSGFLKEGPKTVIPTMGSISSANILLKMASLIKLASMAPKMAPNKETMPSHKL